MAERTVTVDGVPYPCGEGTRLGELLARIGALPMPCGGHGRCGKCRVCVTGDVLPPDDHEKKLLGAAETAAGIRLACRVTVTGDCAVTVPREAGDARIRTDGTLPDLTPDPAFFRVGAAVDIGTTTLAARLLGRNGEILAETSRLNPQSAWGADVITRMEAALAGHAGELASSVREAVNGMILSLTREAGLPDGAADGAVVTGNTAMLSLMTETDTEPLTHAPFLAARLFGETVPASSLGFGSLSPDASVYFPPCAGAFVGADMMCSLLASDIPHRSGTRLLTDIGTNGEMILSHQGRLLAASTAAGPAFEGAGISMGMGGRGGAIDRVRAEDGRLSARVIGGGEPVGICGSGIVDAVAALLEIGALDETGYLENDPAPIAGPVSLTQDDIRMVQLAKSAIHAGLRTLLRTVGAGCEEVEELAVAGGFGSYLDIGNAGAIGLLPAELLTKVRILGNAALSGASMLLLSVPLRGEIEVLARRTETVSLAANPTFAEEYMERMLF